MLMSAAIFTITIVAMLTLNHETAATPVPTWQPGFIRLYEQAQGDVDPDTEAFLIEEATLSCARLSNGYTLPEVWKVGVRDGMSSDQAATVINTAVLSLCPEVQARLSTEADQHQAQGNTTWVPITGKG